ncbi:MAG: hypothetical protein HOV68_25365, partial [Streptomycetaceae bacterium]|nr:hypothetical protein [Streptomycetaceae bacterium]
VTACGGDGEHEDLSVVLGQDSGDGGGDGGGGGSVPKELVGVWTTGSVSGVDYQDAITGAYAPPSGDNAELTIKADGSYSENGLLQTSMYNCTTTLFVTQEGKTKVEGDKITFKPSKLKTSMKDTCVKSSNFENRDGDKKARVNTFAVGKDEYGIVLRLTDADGATSDYRPKKD